jgi:hypothetical protein
VVVAEQRADQAARCGRGHAVDGDQPAHATSNGGDLVAHGEGLDAARDVLGHRDPSVTARHYIADTGRVVDVRNALDPVFA